MAGDVTKAHRSMLFLHCSIDEPDELELTLSACWRTLEEVLDFLIGMAMHEYINQVY